MPSDIVCTVCAFYMVHVHVHGTCILCVLISLLCIYVHVHVLTTEIELPGRDVLCLV